MTVDQRAGGPVRWCDNMGGKSFRMSQQSVVGGNASDHRGSVGFWAAISVGALLLRIALLPLGPRYGYTADHDDNVRWGIQATDEGILTLYDHPPPRWDSRVWDGTKWVTARRQLDRLCNYPPLSVDLLYVSGLVFKQVSADRLINTVTSRTVFAGWSILADFLLALGCAALVAHFSTARAGRWTYLIMLLAPPFWWDTVGWGQMDTVFLAPVVWMVWAMVRQRWILAGVLYGLAAMVKPQAILLLALWAFATMVHRPVWKVLLGLAASAAVAFAISLPFTLHGGFAWLNASYIDNLLHAYPATTLKAFNVWYLDLLLCESDDVTRPIAGIAKDSMGRVMLVVALAVGLARMIRRWGREPRALVLWTLWVLLACVMLPTRVHERYLLLALPLLMVAAMVWRSLWPGLALLLVVATAQVAWPLWIQADPGGWEQFERRAAEKHAAWLATLEPQQKASAPSLAQYLAPARREYLALRARTAAYEWALVGLALAGAVYTAVGMLLLKPRKIKTLKGSRAGRC